MARLCSTPFFLRSFIGSGPPYRRDAMSDRVNPYGLRWMPRVVELRHPLRDEARPEGRALLRSVADDEKLIGRRVRREGDTTELGETG
jgi:hypothetical protein